MARGGQLRIRVVGDTSNLRKSLGKGTKQIGAFAKKAAKIGAAGVAALGAAAVGGAMKVASFGDEIAKSAQKAGLGVEQFQELRFAFKQGGVEAGTFDTAVQKFNKRLGESATMGGTADEAFQRLGVSLRDADGNVRDASGAMDEVLPKLAEIQSDAERAAVAGDLFGQRAGPELAAALSDGGEGIDAARQKAQDLGIVMSKEATKTAEEFTDKLDDLKQSALGLLRKGLTPVMGWLADTGMPFLQSRVIPALEQFRDWLGPKIEEAAGKIRQVLSSHVMPVLEQLSAWWEDNGPQIMAMAKRIGDFLQSNWKPLLIALGAIIGGVVVVAIGSLVAAIVGLVAAIGPVVGAVAGLVAAFTAAYNNSEKFRDIVSSAVDATLAAIKAFVAVAEAVWRTWGETIVRFAREVWGGIKQVIGGFLDVIHGILEAFAGLFTGDWSRMLDGMRQITAGWRQVLAGIIDGLFGAIRAALSVFIKAVTSAWSDLWGAMKRTVVDAVGDFGSLLVDAGRDLIRGLINGIKDLAGNVAGAVKDAVGGAVDAGKELLGISSPSKVMEGIGRNMNAGLARGLAADAEVNQQLLGTLAPSSGGGGTHERETIRERENITIVTADAQGAARSLARENRDRSYLRGG